MEATQQRQRHEPDQEEERPPRGRGDVEEVLQEGSAIRQPKGRRRGGFVCITVSSIHRFCTMSACVSDGYHHESGRVYLGIMSVSGTEFERPLMAGGSAEATVNLSFATLHWIRNFADTFRI